MEGCKCKLEKKKDLHVLMNEDNEQIIFQSNNSTSRYKNVK